MAEEMLLRVAATSNAKSLAAAISHGVYDGKRLVLRAIGASAVNQAVKATAIAQGMVGMRGLILYIVPGFDTVQVQGKDTTAIVIRVHTGVH